MHRLFFLFLFFLLFLFTGCSKFRKIQKNTDWRVKYEAALKYFDEQDYHRSTLLLEDILPIIRGTQEAELGNLRLAYCYYHQRQYILSNHHFDQFITIYGRSEYVEEASYMSAFSLYLQSPEYQLDQTQTYEAVAAMQNFINRYPSSKFAGDADRIIDELQVKLEKKAYENCKLYHRLERLKSTLIVLDNFKKNFPDSDYNEEIAFLKIEASYKLASTSIYSKQEERFRQTTDFYLNFIDKYPKSEFLQSAEEMYDDSIEKITKFASSQ